MDEQAMTPVFLVSTAREGGLGPGSLSPGGSIRFGAALGSAWGSASAGCDRLGGER